MRFIICLSVLILIGPATAVPSQEAESRQSDISSKVARDEVRGEWRLPNDKFLRITGRVKVVGETNLNSELVRNGWAMAHHSGTAAWEAIAREKNRGLWRGEFVFPERWRTGERLPHEK